MLKKITLLFIMLSFVACKPFLKAYYGIKKPKVETNKSLVKFVRKANVSSNEIYYIDSISSYVIWKDTTILERIPQMEIYNGRGELLKKMEAKQCSYNFGMSLETVDLEALKPVVIEPKNLSATLADFKRIDNHKPVMSDFKETDFIVCYTYFKAFGKLSKDYMEEWTSHLSKNKLKERIKILYLDLDMHVSWGVNKKDDRWLVIEF